MIPAVIFLSQVKKITITMIIMFV